MSTVRHTTHRCKPLPDGRSIWLHVHGHAEVPATDPGSDTVVPSDPGTIVVNLTTETRVQVTPPAWFWRTQA